MTKKLVYLVFYDDGEVSHTLQVCKTYQQARQLVRECQQFDADHESDATESPQPGSAAEHSVKRARNVSSTETDTDTTNDDECFEFQYELHEHYDRYLIVGLEVDKFYGWHFDGGGS